ncbi:MAG: hypothetical protein HRU14_14600, partial [Planctomycetes bacterium]|nr:hypothetical protein [Planctomycetota bacterium]
MSDETTSNAPGGEAPAPPPLRATFLVWPGKVHGQTWMFLWLGVAYLIGALLPWHGANDVEYVLATPIQTQSKSIKRPELRSAVIKVADYKRKVELQYNGSGTPPPAIVAVREPGKSFGTVLILLCAIAMVVAGVVNVWNRKLVLTPTLMTWFVALAVLYFSKGTGFVEISLAGATRHFEVSGFSQIGDTLGAIFGNFATVIEGKATPEMHAVFDRFGMGFYLTMLAEVFLIAFILFTLVSGAVGKKSDGGASGAKSGAA